MQTINRRPEAQHILQEASHSSSAPVSLDEPGGPPHHQHAVAGTQRSDGVLDSYL